MSDPLDQLSEVLLMGPGPSCVPPEVYQALARPTIGHLNPRFIAIMDEIKILLGQVIGTENRLTLPISGTQKCLSCPPGLAPVSLSEQAVAKLRARRAKVPNWYLDLTLIVNYWEGAKRAYHHTAPFPLPSREREASEASRVRGPARST